MPDMVDPADTKPKITVPPEADVLVDALLDIDETDTTGAVPEEEKKEVPAELITRPIVNDPTQVLSVGIPPNSAVSVAVADPTVNDKLVSVVKSERSTVTLLNTILEEIAEETAFIKAWRNASWNQKDDLSEATDRRVRMLRHMVETIVEREKLKRDRDIGKIDFYSENFQRVLEYFMQTIQKVFKEVGIPQQYEDIFVTQLAKSFDGFEKKAEKIYYGKK